MPATQQASASAPTSKCTRRRRFGRRDGLQRIGAYTVEFAICAPVFFMTVFGCLELARYMYIVQAIDQTCYEAAREGVIAGAKIEDVTSRANALLNAYGIRVSNLDVQPETIDIDTESVTVSITYDFAENSWVMPKYVTGGPTTCSVTLDHENQAILVPQAATNSEVLNENDEPLDV